MRECVRACTRRVDHPTCGDGLEVGLVAERPLGVEDESGEDDHGEEEEDGEHEQLLHARLDGVHEDLQGAVVLHEVEHAEDAHNAQDEDRLEHGAVVQHAAVRVDQVEGDLHQWEGSCQCRRLSLAELLGLKNIHLCHCYVVKCCVISL